MKLTITNKLELKEYPNNLQQIIIEELKVPNPAYAEALNNGRSTFKISPFILHFDLLPNDILRLPRGYIDRLLELSKEFGIEIETTDKRKFFEQRYDIISPLKYRPYQKKAILSLIRSLQGVLRAPAGSGKTVMGLSLVALLGQPTLWLTHTDRLLKQTLERARTFLPSLKKDDIGIIGGGKWKIGNVLTIGMVQTLMRRPVEAIKLSEAFGLIILDEAHHCPAKTFLNVVSYFNPYYLYGLTATPYRRDGLETIMFQAIGPETVKVTMEDVKNEGGIIVPKVLYRTINTRTDRGNDMPRLLKELTEDEERNRIIVGDVIHEAMKGNRCIVMSDRRAHCERLYELIALATDRVGIATGAYKKKDIDKTIKEFEDDKLNVLVATFSLLGEGFDVNVLNRAFIAMPIRARGRVEQFIGRIQRTAPGKIDAIVYDYVDSNIPVLFHQFYSKNRKDCRFATYQSLGVVVEPYK